MKVKMITNQIFLDKLRTENMEERLRLANPERYGTFQEIFGEDDFGFILAGDLLNETKNGEQVQVYGFGENLSPYKISKGIECDLLIASSLSTRKNGFSSREEVEEIMNYLEEHKTKGDIENLVNSSRGTLFEDKRSIIEINKQGIRTPQTFYFKKFDELKDFVSDSKEEYIIKHRFGQEGLQLARINYENIGDFRDWKISDFIVQEKLEILNEKRLILFEDELLASRKISDRHMPWEEEGKAGRRHITEKYTPTQKEIEDSMKIMKYSDTTVGSMDWISTKEKGDLLMELNGIGTGYGRGKHPYNVNRLVAQKLKDKFL